MITRRKFILKSAMSAGTILTLGPSLMADSFSQEKILFKEDPHFFLQVFFSGGVDPTYLFDARPLEMTKNKLLQNYIGKEPKLWTGANGNSMGKAASGFPTGFRTWPPAWTTWR